MFLLFLVYTREIVIVVQVKRKVLIQLLPCSLLKDFILCLMVPVSAICVYNLTRVTFPCEVTQCCGHNIILHQNVVEVGDRNNGGK